MEKKSQKVQNYRTASSVGTSMPNKIGSKESSSTLNQKPQDSKQNLNFYTTNSQGGTNSDSMRQKPAGRVVTKKGKHFQNLGTLEVESSSFGQRTVYNKFRQSQAESTYPLNLDMTSNEPLVPESLVQVIMVQDASYKQSLTQWQASVAKESISTPSPINVDRGVFQQQSNDRLANLIKKSALSQNQTTNHKKMSSISQADATNTLVQNNNLTTSSHQSLQQQHAQQEPKQRLTQNLKTVKSPRLLNGYANNTLVKRKDINGTLFSQEKLSQLTKGLLSPKRTQAKLQSTQHQHEKKNQSKSPSRRGEVVPPARASSAYSQQLGAKLSKATSQKNLTRQKLVKSGRNTKKTMVNQKEMELQVQETWSSIQPPMSSSKLINASRRKFISTPRNSSTMLIAKMQTAKNGLIQRKLSNKILTPVASKTVMNTSPKQNFEIPAKSSIDSANNISNLNASKPHQGGFSAARASELIKSNHIRVQSDISTSNMPFLQESAPSSTKQVHISKPSTYITSHLHTPSLLTNTQQSISSLLIKAPSQLGFGSHHKTTQSDQIPKMHLIDRPKTTMLLQLQQDQQKYHHQRQQTATGLQHPNRVLSPRQQQILTQSTEAVKNEKVGGMQKHRSSGDFTLQTYRHTSQSSMGLISVKSMAANLQNQNGAPDSLIRACRTADPKKGALTQPRFSTTTKTARSDKKGNPSSLVDANKGVFGCRKGSKKVLNKEEVFSDDTNSNKSAKTHIIDEVLHQQKFEAYQDLQRQQNSLVNQYGIVETISMGQIIEQEDELHDLSAEKAQIAQELETEFKEESAKHNMSLHKKSEITPIKDLLNTHGPKQPHLAIGSKVHTNNYVTPNTKLVSNRAKTTINLQDLRTTNAMDSAFSTRKKSNDTIIQTREGPARKSSLAVLLKPTHAAKAAKESSSQVVIDASKYFQPEDNPRGLISESLVNSYLTGNGSAAGHSYKWMCSSKSAKNVLTSCSLGPKSELRQTEQASALSKIKILPSGSKINSTKTIQNTVVDDLEPAAQSSAQQGLDTPQPRVDEATKKGIFVTQRAFGPKNDIGQARDLAKVMTETSLKPAHESFKSTLVDYTESMNENQISKLTLEQSRELLIQACKAGDLRTVRRLSQIRSSGYEIANCQSSTDLHGNTPLHFACMGGQVEIVEVLIRKMNADVNSINNFGETPLHLACITGHKGVIERLLLARASTNIRDITQGNTPLHVLAQANHQKNQLTTYISDTVIQTMDSCHQVHDIKEEVDETDECLVTEDFVDERIGLNRYSLIELILPFAEESKSILNKAGLIPCQLAQSNEIASLLRPFIQSKKHENEQSTPPVTASLIQGQGNREARNSTCTRNHSANNLDQVIEIKHVSECEIANVFTFYNSSKAESLDKIRPELDKQFTFQASQSHPTIEKEPSDVYMTASSRESRPRGRPARNNNQMVIEEEKNDRRAFLDEEIEQIDNLMGYNYDDSNEYTARDGYVQPAPKQQQVTYRVAKLDDQNGPANSESEQRRNETHVMMKHSDTPIFQKELDRKKKDAANSTWQNIPKSQQTYHKVAPYTNKLSSTALEVQQPANSNLSPKKQKSKVTASKGSKPATSSNQTIDSNSTAAKKGGKLEKFQTQQLLRPLSTTHKLSQNWSTAKLKLVDIDVKSLGSQQKLLKTPSHTLALQKQQSSVQKMRTTQSALDLKQKVDQQACLLLEAMQRSQSRVQLESAFEKPRVGPDQFVAHQLLGTGSFGEVFLVERKQDKKLLAMKVLCKKKIKQQNLKKYAITERNVMCSMGEHPFIVQLRYAFQTKDHLFLISDYCPGGDLSQYLEIEGAFSEEKAKLYVQEILLGIEALHKQNIIFRDLKPDNVIIDKYGHAMLTDFGLSRENVRRAEIGAKSFCGSYAYLAPEMLKKNGHGKAVDWYLLGVILFEMVTGLPPYYADDKEQLFKNIMRDTIDMRKVKGEQNLSNECIDLMQRLLKKDPAKRIGTARGAGEIREHPFFRDTNWAAVYDRQQKMPEPYLAGMAMDIIKQQPYLVAGHPHTVGEVCPRDHRSYLQGWSFTQQIEVGTESQLSSSEKIKIHSDPRPEQEMRSEDFLASDFINLSHEQH